MIRAVCACMAECSANPSAAYTAAGKARREIRLAKETLSQMLGCDRSEIIFTSGGTEANNLALKQAAGRHVILSAMEHKSVLEAAKHLGCEISLVAPNANGQMDAANIQGAIRSNTALISVQTVNNETGVIQSIAEIGAIARQHNILFHTDAVQAFGHMPIDVNAANIDLLSASAHKLYGPRGIGFLYVRQGVPAIPLILGGRQEGALRAGTENVPAIAGFRVAAELAEVDMTARRERVAQLMTAFITALKQKKPEIMEISAHTDRLPGIRALRLPRQSSEWVIAKLDSSGIRVSGGAACGTSEATPSHVLLAMGFSEIEANEVIRISPGRHTTAVEMQKAAETISGLL